MGSNNFERSIVHIKNQFPTSKMNPKVVSTSPSCLEAQIVYEGEILYLFTVTFWEKVDFYIMNTC